MEDQGKHNHYTGNAKHVVLAGTVYGGIKNGHDTPTPRQLPRPATCFTNRIEAMARLSELATNGDGVVLVSGPAGVGKSALAVFWAHSVKKRFPDGQLYINLRGYDRLTPLSPEQALLGFLSALGTPVDSMPLELAAMSALFRSLLDGKRFLIVVDNAASSEQVRPLLPSTAECFTIVTSRSLLSSLTSVDGAAHISIKPLDTSSAVELFSRLSGHRDTAGASRIVLSCGRLPLTVRIAARQASYDASLTAIIEEVAESSHRLEALSALDEEMEVRSVFSWSYQHLSADTARAFRLLSLHAGPDLSVPAAAALMNLPETEARRLLRRLTAANLLEEVKERRYAYHDLLREYAREKSQEVDSSDDRRQALHRELLYYLYAVDDADRILVPERKHVPLEGGRGARPVIFLEPATALAWCDAELPNLVSAVQQAVELGFDEIAWKLPVALIYFLRLRGHNMHRFELAATAVQASRRLGDRWAETWTLICLGGAESDLLRHEDALAHFEQALDISREIGDRHWEATSAYNVAWALRLMGRYELALQRQNEALTIHQANGDARGAAIALCEIGTIELKLGHPSRAADSYECARAGARETEDLPTEATSLHGLGEVFRLRGCTREAIDWYRRAITVRRRIGDVLGLAQSLMQLGEQLNVVGDPPAAREALAEAATLFDSVGDPTAEEARRHLQNLTSEA
ncbi:tetratricopeptide repeat protein [Streptomyces albogriseolus]|uniref:ATP-binding protein n=1 Tax=Streptomyces albogriseolus TaxID=1887 RepID=UPI00345F5424